MASVRMGASALRSIGRALPTTRGGARVEASGVSPSSPAIIYDLPQFGGQLSYAAIVAARCW